MADNWEDVADFLLRNRSIREMADEVMKSLDEMDHDCNINSGKLLLYTFDCSKDASASFRRIYEIVSL